MDSTANKQTDADGPSTASDEQFYLQLSSSLKTLFAEEASTKLYKEDLAQILQQRHQLDANVAAAIFDDIDTAKHSYITHSEFISWANRMNVVSLREIIQLAGLHMAAFVGQSSDPDGMEEKEESGLLKNGSEAADNENETVPQPQPQSNVARVSSKLQAVAALAAIDESKQHSETAEQALGFVHLVDHDHDHRHDDDDDDNETEEEKYPEPNDATPATHSTAQVRKSEPRSSTPRSLHSDDHLLGSDTSLTGAPHHNHNHNGNSNLPDQAQSGRLLMAQQSYSAPDELEYACKRSVRPVRNNVFMEKTMEQCTVPEIHEEIDRLISCLHFLSEEFDIFQTLTGFLKSNESEFEEQDMSSPFEFAKNRKRTDDNGDDDDDDDDEKMHHVGSAKRYTQQTITKQTTIYAQMSMKRSETSKHIQWLHMAYVTERTQRLSAKKLDRTAPNKEPPNFGSFIEKKFSAKYERFCSAFSQTVLVLTQAYARAHADENSNKNGNNGASNAPGGSPLQDSLINELKQKQKLQALSDAANDAVFAAVSGGGGMNDHAAMIAQMVTMDSGDAAAEVEAEAMALYNEDRSKYDPVFSCTPTEDEMQCYLSLSRAVFNDNIMSQILSVGMYGRVKDAFFLLRCNDRAVAQENNGWVTTIDNILCVLLFRDLHAYRKRFVGELQLAMVVSGSNNDRLSTYENRVRLTVLKDAIRASFIGRPPDQDAADNCFEREDIVLRDKSSYSTNLCVCCKQCEGTPMVRLVFGIQCDDSKLGWSANQPQQHNTSRLARKFPYKFLYQSKRLFELIHRKKFAKVFNADRELRRFARLEEIHEYDLQTFEYPKNEMDQQLLAYYAVMNPSTTLPALPVSSASADLYDGAPNAQSMDDIYDATQGTMRGFDIYGRGNTVRRVQTVEQHFTHAFETTNLVEAGVDTILEEDFGVLFETRFVNWLNRLLSFYHAKFVYTRLTAEEIEKNLAAEQKQEQGDLFPTNATNEDGAAASAVENKTDANHLDVNALPSSVDDMNRHASNQSAEGVDTFYDKLSDDEKYRKGHRFCCGYCFVSCGMVFFSVLMAVIVGIGCWQIWSISEVPLEPTIRNLLSFTEQMIGAETEHVVQRALFSTNQFIEFVQVLPTMTQPMDSATLFNSFLDDELIANPRYDGIIQLHVPWSDNITDIDTSFVFKTRSNELKDYHCTLSLSEEEDSIGDDDECHVDLYSIASELLLHFTDGVNHTQIHTFFLSDAIIDGPEYADQGHLWFVTWRTLEIEDASATLIIAGMFRSSRISDEYQKWPIARDGCVYWVTHDDYRDVFVTSLQGEPLYISEHSDEVSSINLNSNFGFALDANYTSVAMQVDYRILHTLDKVTDALNQSIEADGYFIYSSLQNASFGAFYVVVVFPQDEVYAVKNLCQTLWIVVMVVAMVLAFVTACLANAIPLIPADDSWLAVPYFTDQDKQALEEYEEDDEMIDGRTTTLSSPSRSKRRGRKKHRKNSSIRDKLSMLKKRKKELAATTADAEAYKPIKMSVSPMSPPKHNEQTLIANMNISQPLPEDKDLDDDDDVLRTMNRRQRSNSAGDVNDQHLRVDSKSLAASKLAALSASVPASTEMVPVNSNKNKGKGKRPAALSMPGPYNADAIQHANTDNNFGEKKRQFHKQNTDSCSSFHIDDDEDDDDFDDGDSNENKEENAEPVPSGQPVSSRQLLGRPLPQRAVSVNTAQMQHLSPHTSVLEEIQQQRKRQARQKRKEKRRRLQLYKKKQQRLQLQRNINHANMRSIFSRETDSHRTKYGKRVGRVINGMCTTVVLLVCGLYLLLRTLTGDDLEALMTAHLKISGYMMVTHAEFKVYQHGLALQQGELLLASPEFGESNPDLLYSFYDMFDELTGVFTFRDTSELNQYELSNFSIFGNAALDPSSNQDEQCLKMHEIEVSSLATCIKWDLCDNNATAEYQQSVTSNVTDCTLYRAIQETFVFFSEHSEQKSNFIGWSIPFACFGGQKICYVGLTRLSNRSTSSPLFDDDSKKQDLFVGALLSMHLLADVAEDVVWHKSGISDVVSRREQQQQTAYSNIEVQFSFYLYVSLNNALHASAGFFADAYGVDGDYLLATSGNEVITTTQTSYGVPINSIVRASNSSNSIVRRTYIYLNSTGETNSLGGETDAEPLIAPQTWSYPLMVFYRYVNDDGLNWVSVITIDSEIFMGDHVVYVSVGSLSLFGWVIIYLFFHYVSHRRFQENIRCWEMLYEAQLEREMFPIWYESENEELEKEQPSAVGSSPLVDAPGKDSSSSPPTTQQQQQQQPPQPQQQQGQNMTWDAIEEQATLNFISENIRDTVRKACQQDWIRQQTEDTADLPVNRRDVTDHYHKRALLHIHQAKRGMNIITVVQMEQYGQGGAYRLMLYRLQSSNAWKFIIQAFMIMHCMLVFWRPLTDVELAEGYDTAPLALEVVCLVFECIDLMLTFCIQFQWQDTSKNPLMSPSQQRGIFWARVVIWTAVVVDVILITTEQTAGYSFTRIFPIRPLLLILSTDKLVGACYSLMITSFEALDVLLLAAILLVIGAIVGVILFRFDALMQYYNVYSFHNMVRSLFSTYVFIISGENYGEVVYDAFHESFLYIGFFIVLTVLGSWIVISLVVSRFQTSFKQIYGRERQRRIYFKRTGYVAAFSLINLDDDNQVSKGEFESFVRYLKTKNTAQRRRSGNKRNYLGNDEAEVAQELLKELKWDELDADGSDSIDIREFVTKLEEIYQKPALINIINDNDSLSAWIRLNVVETEAFSQFVLVIILMEISVFCFMGLYPGTNNMEMLDSVLGITIMLNALDIIVKISSLGWSYYWNTSKCRVINRHKTVLSKTDDNNYGIDKQRLLKQQQQQKQNRNLPRHQHTSSGMPILANLDVGALEEDRSTDIQALGGMHEPQDSLSLNGLPGNMFAASPDDEDVYEESVYTQNPLHLKEREFAHRFDLIIVALAVLSFVFTRTAVGAFTFDDKSNVWRIVMVLPLFRLFTLIKTTRSAVYIIVKVIPRFGWLFLILLILFYIYAVFGVWLIGDELDTRLLDPPQYSFSTFHDSLVTLFQLTVGEGWHNVMYDTVYTKNSLLVTTPYFLSFVLMITLIFTNLFVGLVISVVDDVNQENKNTLGQLQQERLQQQWEETVNEKSEENTNNNNNKETTLKHTHGATATLTNDEIAPSAVLFNNRSATHRNLGSNYLNATAGPTKTNVFSPTKRGSAMWSGSSKLYL